MQRNINVCMKSGGCIKKVIAVGGLIKAFTDGSFEETVDWLRVSVAGVFVSSIGIMKNTLSEDGINDDKTRT